MNNPRIISLLVLMVLVVGTFVEANPFDESAVSPVKLPKPTQPVRTEKFGGTSGSETFTTDSARPGVFITGENIVRDQPNGARIACPARNSALKILRFDGD